MDESGIEEETYSLIFKSLKHPIRRRILRILTDGPKAFSEILAALDIDSGHLSYHIDGLGELVTHAPEGKYKLSSIGLAATKLMSGVEEQTASHSRTSVRHDIFKLFVTISLVLTFSILALSSCILYMHTESWGGPGCYMSTPRPIPLDNSPFIYNFTIAYMERPAYCGGGAGFFYTEAEFPLTTPTTWTRDWFRVNIFINGSGFRVLIYDPDGQLVHEENIESGGFDGGFYIDINEPGTYRLVIEWLDNRKIYDASFSIEWERTIYVKPYYNYALIGLLISTVCPFAIITLGVWTRLKS